MTHFTDLLDGYRQFRTTEWQEERERWSELAEGQSPKVMVIACSDSRVEPAIIFGARPGEMFVVPKGKEHKPYARDEVKMLLIEPRGVKNTGGETNERTAQNDVWI